jgi:hypothetical protein
MFFNWCIEESYLLDNPLKNFRNRKAESPILSVSENTLKAY